MNQQLNIPVGYLKDNRGRLVPIENVEPIDIERNDMVLELIKKAKELREEMLKFKLDGFGDVAALVELSLEQYGVKVGGKKGNVSLTSFDGKYKIQRSIAEHIEFDERLLAAKALIDKCIHRWTENSGNEIKVLVEQAFQVDKQGNLSTARILGLRRSKIDDADWLKAMEAIADSIQVTGSKSYLRFYERCGETDQFKPVSLDLAKL
jgi:hypothetical protein